MRLPSTTYLLLLQSLTYYAANVILDNSVIWTADANGLFYLNQTDTETWLFSQSARNLTLRKMAIPALHNIIGMSYDYSTDQVIVSDPNTMTISIVNLNGPYGTPFHIGTSMGVGQLTIDWRARNVYWTDSQYGWIAMKSFPKATNTVNSLDRSFRIIVDMFLDKPTGIIVYPLQHYLFWADAGHTPKIERSDPIGGSRTVLVWQGLITPTCLSIDNNTERLFWSDRDRETIEYIYFNGSGRTIFVSQTGYDFYGIAVFQDRLIYTAPNANLTGVYWLTKAYPGTKINTGMPFYYVDVYDKDTQPRSPLEACDSSQFDCDQICVHMKDDRGATCVCEDGYDLVQGKNCQAKTTVLERHILFTLNNDICATSVNLIYSSNTVPPPTNCSVVRHSSTITRFSIDMNNDYIFFTNGSQIYKQVPFGDTKSLLYETSGTVIDMDFDWKTNELYWVEEGNARVQYKIAEDYAVTPSQLPPSPTSTPIKTLAVDPHNNHVYWISRDGSTYTLHVWDREDNSVREIITSSISNPSDIEYDRINDRLLWNDDTYYGIIRPDGTGSQKVDTFPDIGVRHGIAVYKKLVLCTIEDAINHFDVYFDEETTPFMANSKNVPLNSTIYDMHVFDSTTQLNVLDACDVDNNGCEHLCLPGDTTRCACNLGYELNMDGNSCSSTPLIANFSLVLDGLYGRVFQFQSNVQTVNLRIIEIAASNQPVAMTYDDARNKLTWVDGKSKSVRRINILEGSEETLTGSDFLETSVIAVDILTGNTYVTHGRKLYVVYTSGSKSAIIDESDVQGVIKSIAIYNRTIAWIEGGNEPRIMRSNLDGKNIQTVVSFDADRIASPEVIKFDQDNGNIYWCDSVKDKIERVDSNLEATMVYQKQYHNPVAFDLYGSMLYYIPDDKRRIFVIDKTSGKEVSVVMETPIIGAINSIHVSRPVTLPTSPPPAVYTTETSPQKLSIVPIAAGAGGGLLVLIIIIIVIVCYCKRIRNDRRARRRPSKLPAISDIRADPIINSSIHDYAGMGNLSPNPPPRPLTKDEEGDGGVYHELDDVALTVDLPSKDGKNEAPVSRPSTRYSHFPNQHDGRPSNTYITPTYMDNHKINAQKLHEEPEPDYGSRASYLELSSGITQDRLGMTNNAFMVDTGGSTFTDSDDGYLMSSSVTGSKSEYSRNLRVNRDFSDGSANDFSREGRPHAHKGGWHGESSAGDSATPSKGYSGFIQKR